MRQKSYIFGGISLLALVIIIVFGILSKNNNGNDKDDYSTMTTEDENISTEDAIVDEVTTENKRELTDEQLAYGMVLKNQIFEMGYDVYNDAYLHLLEVYRNAYYYEDMTFSLIDFNGDDILELVADVNNCITMYTYREGIVYKLLDSLEYDSKISYEYLSGNRVIRNCYQDYDGLITYETYLYINLNGEEVAIDVYNLKKIFFEDVNKNGIPDNDENIGGEYLNYYIEETPVTEKQYSKIVVEGEYNKFVGEFLLDEFIEKLKNN